MSAYVHFAVAALDIVPTAHDAGSHHRFNASTPVGRSLLPLMRLATGRNNADDSGATGESASGTEPGTVVLQTVAAAADTLVQTPDELGKREPNGPNLLGVAILIFAAIGLALVRHRMPRIYGKLERHDAANAGCDLSRQSSAEGSRTEEAAAEAVLEDFDQDEAVVEAMLEDFDQEKAVVEATLEDFDHRRERLVDVMRLLHGREDAGPHADGEQQSIQLTGAQCEEQIEGAALDN